MWREPLEDPPAAVKLHVRLTVAAGAHNAGRTRPAPATIIPTRYPGLVRLAAALALATVLYGNTLANDLVWDDRLTATAPLALAVPTGAWFRPFTMATFAIDRRLWNDWPAGFHLTNLCLHAGVAWLLGALVVDFGAPAGLALASTLVFLAHPVQSEAVAYVSGRTDLLCALWSLIALRAWRRARHAADAAAWATTAALVAALLSKEAAVLVPLVLLVPGAHPATRAPRPWLPLTAVAGWLVLWTRQGGAILALGDLVDRLPAIAVMALTYVRLLLWPADLHLERFIPVPGWSPATTACAWAACATLLALLACTARRTTAGWALLALAAVTYAPAAGIIPVYPAIADRALFAAEHFLYLPLLGLAPLGVAALGRTVPRPTAAAVLAVVLLAWGVIVVDRNRDWRTEEVLFRHTVAFDPPAARVWFNLGNLALAAGQLDDAERWYRAALVREPGDAGAHLNLGIVHQRRGRRGEAEEEYRRALAADPQQTDAARGLAALLAARGAMAEAARVLETVSAPGAGAH